MSRGDTYSKPFSLLVSDCLRIEKSPSRAGARSREISFLDSYPLTPYDFGPDGEGLDPSQDTHKELSELARGHGPLCQARGPGQDRPGRASRRLGWQGRASAREHGLLEVLEAPHAPGPSHERPPASQRTAQQRASCLSWLIAPGARSAPVEGVAKGREARSPMRPATGPRQREV